CAFRSTGFLPGRCFYADRQAAGAAKPRLLRVANLRRAQLFSPRWVECAQARHALADGRVCHEERREAFFGEWVDRVERLGCRACLKLHESSRLLESDQCVCEPVRRVAELRGSRVCEELALRREEQIDERGCKGPQDEQQAALE